ncbi:fibronectin type III domain-containing protein [Micromonospora sp. NBC_01638]|uniref:fibronectin type III domain-containing protein n=1 Tax=Micromonospora sp. NBC_01638 TaxID=2975982 RepID=UPI003865B17A|nr:fibronectin type III domain-containing protein [Micromonospora sp. NBC_01638]
MSSASRLRALAGSALAGLLVATALTVPGAAAARAPDLTAAPAQAAVPRAPAQRLEPTGPRAAPAKLRPPSAPAAPKAARKGTKAVVTWKAPAANGSPITGYVVTHYRNGTKAKSTSVDAAKTSATLKLASTKGTWTFTVAARNAAGAGPASKRSAPPKLLALPDAPTLLAATADVTTAVVSWRPPASDGGSPITNYVIVPYVGGVKQPSQTVPATPLTATVSGLTAGVTYTFTVAALSGQGLGPESAPSHSVIPNESPWVFWDGASTEVGVAYSHIVDVVRGRSPYTFSVTYGALPPGLSINPNTGSISGIPTAAGSYALVVRVTSSLGLIGSRLITIPVTPAPNIVIASIPLAEITGPYSLRPTVVGGVAPYTWSIAAGALPPGLTVDPNTGQINGLPTTAGTFGLDLRVTDAAGLSDVRQIRLVVQPHTVVTLNVSTSSVAFDSPITLTANLGPGETAGTVTVFDRQRSGVIANLGSTTVLFSRATITLKPPAFGLNELFVRYDSTLTTANSTSNTVPVQVNGMPGQLLIQQFRQSGLANIPAQFDQFVALYNNTSIPMQLPGITVEAPGGVTVVIPSSETVLEPRHGYLIGTGRYNISVPTLQADLVVPTLGPVPNTGATGLRLRVPDAASTVTDAAGSTPGYFTGNPLPAFNSPPTVRNAWVRIRVRGNPQDTRNNPTDFRLVSTTLGPINGVPSALGTPSPLRQAGPFEQSSILQTTLLDPSKAANEGPNQQIVDATPTSPKRLIVRRGITNRGITPATLVRLRITTLSQPNGAPNPGVPPPPNPAQLRLVNPDTATGTFTVGGRTVTVNNLRMDVPTQDPPGGGLATTLTLPLTIGGLTPGQTLYISLAFEVDQGGRFWAGWDVEAIGGGPVNPPGLAATAAVTSAKEKAANKARQQATKNRKLTNIQGSLR